MVPYINYKWPSIPNDLTKDDYRKGLSRWAVFVACYAPGLLHWWLTQKLFPSSTVLDRNPTFFSRKDLEVLKNTPGYQLLSQVIFTSSVLGKRKEIQIPIKWICQTIYKYENQLSYPDYDINPVL